MVFFLTIWCLAACEPTPIAELSPDEGAARIREHYADERWDMVQKEVNEYRRRHPYSKHAAEVELMLADSNFVMDQFAEAGAIYEEFLRKNVKHPKREYAMFRAAKCYDVQSPKEADREQEFSRIALSKYNRFLAEHKSGSFADEAKERSAIIKRRLADHEIIIGRFYWKKELWHAALVRYLVILEDYSQYTDLQEEARERAAEAYVRLAEILEKDPKSDAVVQFRDFQPSELRAKAESLVRSATPNQPSATR